MMDAVTPDYHGFGRIHFDGPKPLPCAHPAIRKRAHDKQQLRRSYYAWVPNTSMLWPSATVTTAFFQERVLPAT